MGLRKWHGDVATLLVSPKVSMGETMLAPIFLYFVMGGFLFRSHLGRALFLRFRHECSYLFRRRIIGKHVTANLKLTSRGGHSPEAPLAIAHSWILEACFSAALIVR